MGVAILGHFQNVALEANKFELALSKTRTDPDNYNAYTHYTMTTADITPLCNYANIIVYITAKCMVTNLYYSSDNGYSGYLCFAFGRASDYQFDQSIHFAALVFTPINTKKEYSGIATGVIARKTDFDAFNGIRLGQCKLITSASSGGGSNNIRYEKTTWTIEIYGQGALNPPK